MAVDLGRTRRLQPSHYALKNDFSGSFNTLRNWELQGCEDSGAAVKGPWVTLSCHNDDESLIKAPYAVAAWPLTAISCQTAYRTFRLRQIGPNAYGGNELHCGGIELYGGLIDATEW